MSEETKQSPKAIIMYSDWEQLFSSLDNNEQAGELIKALFAFAKRGEIAEFTGALKMAFLIMTQQIERDKKKYISICERRAEYGRKGGEAKASKSKQKLAQVGKSKQNLASVANTKTNTKTNTNTNTECVYTHTEEHTHDAASFQEPTVEEVRAYCQEIGSRIDPQRFVSYYTAYGWKGTNGQPIEDWRAAVRAWDATENKAQKAGAAEYSSIDMSDVERIMNPYGG